MTASSTALTLLFLKAENVPRRLYREMMSSRYIWSLSLFLSSRRARSSMRAIFFSAIFRSEARSFTSRLSMYFPRITSACSLLSSSMLSFKSERRRSR